MTRYIVKLRVFHEMDVVVGEVRRSLVEQSLAAVKAPVRIATRHAIQEPLARNLPFSPDDLIKIKEVT